MKAGERREKHRVERERRIVDAARNIAASEGWDAVTIRQLSDEIGYSQPVLYTHYANKAAIVGAVALDGFRDITRLLQDARKQAVEPAESLRRVAEAYISFAAGNPSLYAAMFALSTNLRFAEADTDLILRDAFSALASVVSPFTTDPDIATEFIWSTLHGLAELERAGRIKSGGRSKRIEMLVRSLAEHSPKPVRAGSKKG